MNVNTNLDLWPEETGPEELTEPDTSPCVNIISLPDDVLYTIFSYLDIRSLGRICCSCSKLRKVASRDCVWLSHSRHLHASIYEDGMHKPATPMRCNMLKRKRRKILKEKCRIAHNWETKTFRDTQFISHPTKLMPWIKLHRQKLYVSNATNINCYSVFNDSTVREDKTRRINGTSHDVTRFVVTDNLIVSGFRGGGIIGYDLEASSVKFEYYFPECNDTQAVAVYNDVVIAGFRNGLVKVINTNQGKSGITDIYNEENSIKVPNRIWSVASPSDGSTFTIGNAGHERNRTPVEVYDLSRCSKLYSLGAECKRGAGVLDIKYETPHTILTCGYDTSLRLWDLRTQTCVQEWVEPFDTELSSLQSDGNNVIITGTFQYGMTRLWDKRHQNPVQMYYCGKIRSPVYCLDTDFERLFVALDFGIHMLDFTVYKNISKC